MALSRDLRCRIVDLVATGVSRRAAARHFKVSASSAVRFVKQAKELGHVEVKPRKRRPSRLDPYEADIRGWIGDQSDLTLQELSERLARIRGVTAAISTLDDWLRAHKISYKKKPHTPLSRSAVMFGRHGPSGASAKPGWRLTRKSLARSSLSTRPT